MKTLIPLSVIGLLFSSSAYASDKHLDLNQRDHQLHAGVAYGATLAMNQVFKATDTPLPALCAAFSVFTVGVVKESLDPAFSAGDLKANALGVASGTIFNLSFKF
jgi:hypothetical protein